MTDTNDKATSPHINIIICGDLSVGKSTILNTICNAHYAETGITQTTFVPQIFSVGQTETDCLTDAQTIRLNSKKYNGSDNFVPIHTIHTIHTIRPVATFKEITDQGIVINIYDMPAITDTSIDNKYFQWLCENIHTFNLIIFVTDIHKGVADAHLLEFLVKDKSERRGDTSLVCVINKYDDIYFNLDNNMLVFGNDEQEEIYCKANDVLNDLILKHNLRESLVPTQTFIPVSAENSFIYKTIENGLTDELDASYQTKLCKNECGTSTWKIMSPEEKKFIYNSAVTYASERMDMAMMNTGYYHLIDSLRSILSRKVYDFVAYNTHLKEKELIGMTFTDADMQTLNQIIGLHAIIIEIFGQTNFDIFWENIKAAVERFVDLCVKKNNSIGRIRYLISYANFESVHLAMRKQFDQFVQIIRTLESVPFYPKEFFALKQGLILEKIIGIYEEWTTLHYEGQKYLGPTSVLDYIKFIHTYAPDSFDEFVSKFLEFTHGNIRMIYSSSNKGPIIELLSFIKDRTTNGLMLKKDIYGILINRQYQMGTQSFENNFGYFILLKNLIKKLIADGRISSSDLMCGLLQEIIDKNICTHMGTDGLVGFCKPGIDYNKMKVVLDRIPGCGSEAEIEFETALLEIIIELSE